MGVVAGAWCTVGQRLASRSEASPVPPNYEGFPLVTRSSCASSDVGRGRVKLEHMAESRCGLKS